MKSTYHITGMHCAGCVRKVEDAIGSLGGVQSVTVGLLKNPDFHR